jgi:hypothetical protein
MEFIYYFILFIIILFLYLHIVYQYKKSEELEIFELDFTGKSHLQEICHLKQPVLFDFKGVVPDFFQKLQPELLESIENTDVRVKDIYDYYSKNDTPVVSVDPFILPFQSSRQLMNTDQKKKYYLENNSDLIEETELYKHFQCLDTFLKPAFTIQTKYDLCLGSKNVCTPMKYHTNERLFLIVSHGKIHVRMTPWKSSKYLHPQKDYENYEFFSPINIWNPQPRYSVEMEKIRYLDFDVYEGYVLSIPPYWWYSIRYSNSDNVIVANCTYNSILNIVAHSPDWVLYFLQQHNIYKKMAKTVQYSNPEMRELKSEFEHTTIIQTEQPSLTHITPAEQLPITNVN